MKAVTTCGSLLVLLALFTGTLCAEETNWNAPAYSYADSGHAIGVSDS